MMRKGIGLAVTLVAALIVASAAAQVSHYSTSITTTGVPTGPPNTYYEYGSVQSPKAACVANRRMKITGHYPNGSHKVLDTTRSSHNGAYAFFADFTGADKSKITAAPMKLGSGGVCSAGSVVAD
jgi:hypothetical protein